jgi:hypothetical protein
LARDSCRSPISATAKFSGALGVCVGTSGFGALSGQRTLRRAARSYACARHRGPFGLMLVRAPLRETRRPTPSAEEAGLAFWQGMFPPSVSTLTNGGRRWMPIGVKRRADSHAGRNRCALTHSPTRGDDRYLRIAAKAGRYLSRGVSLRTSVAGLSERSPT